MFDLEDCLAYLASRSAKQLASALEKRLAPHGISRARWMVLYYTEKYDHLTQARLAGLCGTREPPIVRMIDRMEAEGLVKRKADKDDRRVRVVVPTKKGQALNREILPVVEAFKDDAIRGIPENEMEIFRQVLETMVRNTAS